MARLSMKHKIINYFRHVDDILIIFYPTHSSIQASLDDFNALHQNLQFTAELEENNTINYLDITIQKTTHKLENSHLQKTHIYGHHNTIYVSSPHTTQIRSS